jgi:hypothetical protein
VKKTKKHLLKMAENFGFKGLKGGGGYYTKW